MTRTISGCRVIGLWVDLPAKTRSDSQVRVSPNISLKKKQTDQISCVTEHKLVHFCLVF